MLCKQPHLSVSGRLNIAIKQLWSEQGHTPQHSLTNTLPSTTTHTHTQTHTHGWHGASAIHQLLFTADCNSNTLAVLPNKSTCLQRWQIKPQGLINLGSRNKAEIKVSSPFALWQHKLENGWPHPLGMSDTSTLAKSNHRLRPMIKTKMN